MIDYEMTFNKIVTTKNKRARASIAQEEEDECAYNHDLEISDEQIEEIQVQEKGMKRKCLDHTAQITLPRLHFKNY